MALKRLALVGVGLVGSAVLLRMACSAKLAIKLIDGDIITKKDAYANGIFVEADAEHVTFKANAAHRFLLAHNLSLDTESVPFYIGENNIDRVLEGVDLVIDATDNAQTRNLLNRWCIENSKPLLISSVSGNRAFFYVSDGENACFNCISRNVTLTDPNCTIASVKTATVLADAIAKEVLKLPFGDRPHKFVSINARSNEVAAYTLLKDPSCSVCGDIRKNEKEKSLFVQVCSGGIKVSLQRKLSIKTLLPLFKSYDPSVSDDYLLLRNGGRSILVSKFGDFLFTGYSTGSVRKILAMVSNLSSP
jgi:adenylyltransferase/sulfurtransferase